MHVVAVLNRNGGTLRSLDVEALARDIERVFRAAGHTVEVKLTGGDDLVSLMREVAADRKTEILLAGGGDGTISLAASLVAHTDKALAVLPAGTMNLFARSLEIPLELQDAIASLATGRIRQVDIARANERYFVHQFSIGMHPKLIRIRERMTFRSRIGKMMASVRAAFATLIRPPSLKVRLHMGEAQMLTTTSSLAVTNNLFAEGQRLPFAGKPDGGELGIYVTRAKRRRDLILMVLNMGIGRWKKNAQVEIHRATRVTLDLTSPNKRFKCAMDGELCDLDQKTTFELHPGALAVLAPAKP
ncbi:diacylglycerol/lipid kinase family protein [Nitratireductor indicus]|uniref:Diacylglycerol kinase catalytic subunit n=1 Tax=Nitratireductor indicus C115 TaxID=1231190 RepID=K2N3L2_9HYPH|nr:diacylglycerol kinase family protein [Nitratireductor indicus]EKF41978.1 diacylglycerol kinase catalytic subunit [Nitratireductor indicus C115]MDS1136613.1 diacylglycerol kinase family lipid kinase [Nitratireductor indicus]SFQ47527.1 Diacylglycerol kinase family enzyme [Nitratireductor indicus]